jgi:hypothetical protein
VTQEAPVFAGPSQVLVSVDIAGDANLPQELCRSFGLDAKQMSNMIHVEPGRIFVELTDKRTTGRRAYIPYGRHSSSAPSVVFG